MKYLLLTTHLLMGAFFCNKEQCYDSPDPSRYIHRSLDTINYISLTVDQPYAWQIAKNTFLYIDFNNVADPLKFDWWNPGNHGMYDEVGSWGYKAPSHYLKYVGKTPLFNVDSVITDDTKNYILTYLLDTLLYNKPIFEDRIASNDSLWKTYILGENSVAAVTYFYKDTANVPRWHPSPYTPKTSITSAFNFYITNDRLRGNLYHFSMYFLGFPVGANLGPVIKCD